MDGDEYPMDWSDTALYRTAPKKSRLTMESFSLERNENKITFYCSDESVVDNIYDYIERFIDAENYRRQFHKVNEIDCIEL